MFFTIANPYNEDLEALKIKSKFWAKRYILCFPLRETERELNSYLRKNYKLDLLSACMKIYYGCKFYANREENTLTVVIPDKKLDRLASIITYGPDGKCGSKILKRAFS